MFYEGSCDTEDLSNGVCVTPKLLTGGVCVWVCCLPFHLSFQLELSVLFESAIKFKVVRSLRWMYNYMF